MSVPTLQSWQSVQDEVLRRIHQKVWAPGEMIPTEAELASEFGCARATVNRAMRAVADMGLLERRRKAGTRVALNPVRKAEFEIPVIRAEVEGRNQVYGYALLTRRLDHPPAAICARLACQPDTTALFVRAVHLADATPYVIEDRWINIDTVPDAGDQPFDRLSANEWLLAHAPYTRGDITFSALAATEQDAAALGVAAGAPLFTIERTTWDQDRSITSVRLSFAPGYKIHTFL